MIKNINYQQLLTWSEQGKTFQLIDVREPEEHEDFNIGGLLIPLSELYKSFHKIDKNIPVVFYCKMGVRSQIAIQRIEGIIENPELYNLEGGIYRFIE